MIRYTVTSDLSNATDRRPFIPSKSREFEDLRHAYLTDGRMIKYIVETTISKMVVIRYFDTMEDFQQFFVDSKAILPTLDEERAQWEQSIGAKVTTLIEDLG